MQAVFTGFDSAWGSANSGAICHLVLEDGSLRLSGAPIAVNLDGALAHAKAQTNIDLQVWAIDQPLVVNNPSGCRPVERDLASALMAEFSCGAHAANLGMPPFAEGAPIWSLIRALQARGYEQNPLAIPAAAGGRYYFECYPHPAILGLFDLNGIVKYKARHRNSNEWLRLLGLLRRLESAELPIWNIENFVWEGLPQTKCNEDKLDSIISAYVAAYWWRFGVRRSTVIGDLTTGYMVTPHSERTLAALARVFRGRMNLPGVVNVRPSAVPPVESRQDGVQGPKGKSQISIQVCDWIYFATTAKWSGTVTGDFVAKHKIIVRSVYNTARLRIPNVQHLRSGERILLVHGGPGKPYLPLFSATISASPTPVRSAHHSFEVFSYIDEALREELEWGGYSPDPVIGRFTGISITDIRDLRHLTDTIRRPSHHNTILRWEEVFADGDL